MIINRVQGINLELIRLAGFNNVDGNKVVQDLEANTDLWRGVVMDRESREGNASSENICFI